MKELELKLSCNDLDKQLVTFKEDVKRIKTLETSDILVLVDDIAYNMLRVAVLYEHIDTAINYGTTHIFVLAAHIRKVYVGYNRLLIQIHK